MSYQKLIDTAKSDWGNRPKLAKACELIIEKISQKDADAWRHLTFSSINTLSESILEPNDVVLITQYFAGDRIGLFKTSFEYIGEDDSFVLDNENSYYAYHENVIVHPISGKLIEDVKDDVFMFFTLNEMVIK